MSKASQTLKTLHVGDIVKMSATLVAVTGTSEGYVLRDVQSGDEYTLEPDLSGSFQLEMVKRARRRPPQRQDFEEGQIISGKTVKKVMWRRGTILSHFDNLRGQWVLHGDGKWHSLDYAFAFDFSDFQDEIQYRIASLP